MVPGLVPGNENSISKEMVNTIEAMNIATNKDCDVSWKTMELMIIMFIGMFYDLPVEDIKPLTPNAISSLLASSVSQGYKSELINIAIDWFRSPENLTHLNGVIGCLTVDGMTSTDLAGFRKSLIEAILHDEDRKKLVVETRNGLLSINLNGEQTFRSSIQAKLKAKAEAEDLRWGDRLRPEHIEYGMNSQMLHEMSELVSKAVFFSYGVLPLRLGFVYGHEEIVEFYRIPYVLEEKKVATPEKLKKSKDS